MYVHAQSCPTLCDPMDCSLPGSPVCGIFQARILEWVAMPSSRGSSPPRSNPPSLASPAFIVVQSPSHVLFVMTRWTAARQVSLSLIIFRSLSKFMSIASVMPSSHVILCHPLLMPSISPSLRDFSNKSVLRIRWRQYWNFSFSISPSKEYSGLISLRIDWFDLLAVQGTFRSLLQHHSSKASILWCSACFMVQLSQLYMTTGKTIALTIWTFVSRVMSLFLKTLSRFAIAFLPRSSRLLISWLQSPSAGILEPKKRKPVAAPISCIYWCISGVVCGADLSFASQTVYLPRCALLLPSFEYTKNLALLPAVYVI